MAEFPRGARQVGWILHQSGDDFPWWRVINNSGRISTNCLEHTALFQKELLVNEGVKVTDKFEIDIEKYRYKPRFISFTRGPLVILRRVVDRGGIEPPTSSMRMKRSTN